MAKFYLPIFEETVPQYISLDSQVVRFENMRDLMVWSDCADPGSNGCFLSGGESCSDCGGSVVKL